MGKVETKMNTTIRKLMYKDRRKLSEMIRKLSDKLNDDSLLNLIKSDPVKHSDNTEDKKDDMHFVKLGIKLFNLLLQFLEDDIIEWFADLVGVDVETFKNDAPFDIEITIIEQLTDEKCEFRRFLFGASKLFRSIKMSVNNLKKPNGQSDSI